MSGGHYDYAFGYMNTLAQNIKSDCKRRSEPFEDYGYTVDPLPRDILDHMAFIAGEIEKLAMAAHDIEWLMSGDYGEDTLRERCESWNLSEHHRIA